MAAAHCTAGSRARSWRGRGAALARSPLLLLLVGAGSYAATKTVSGVWELSTAGANSPTFLQPARDIEGIGRPKTTPALRGQRSRVGAGEQDATAVLEKAMGEKKNGHSEKEHEPHEPLPDDVSERQVVPKSLEFDAEPSAPSAAPSWLPVAASLLLGLALGLAARSPGNGPPTAVVAPASQPDAVVEQRPQLTTSKVLNQLETVAERRIPTVVKEAKNVAEKVKTSVAIINEAESKQDQQMRYDDKLAQMYTGLMDSARQAGAKLQDVVQKVAPMESGASRRVSPSVVKKIRDIGDILDEAQADVYKEEWLALQVTPPLLRAYLPLMQSYPLEAFNDNTGDKYVNAATRESLYFYQMQFSVGIDRLEKAVANHKVREVEEAFAKTSLSYDRYLKAGDLYSGYDPVTSTTVFFQNVSDSQLQYTPLALSQPQIRDEVLVLQGPDKGKVGRIIWLGRENEKDLDSKVLSAVVKLEPNPVLGQSRSGGVREVKAYPYSWLVMTRGSNESYIQDLVLATAAAMVSCAVTYPLETIKARAQSNLPPFPPEGPQVLFKGIELNVLREAPNAGFLMAGFNYFTRWAVGLPFVNGNDPNLKFMLMIPSGVVAMCTGAFAKTPVIDISKQVQAGLAKDAGEAVQNVFFKPTPAQVTKNLGRTFMLTIIRGVPFGAFQCLIYEVLKDRTPALLESIGVPIWCEPFIWGGIAGFCTGYLTNPPDVVMQRLAIDSSSSSDDPDKPFSVQETWEEIVQATQKILENEGPAGFAKGGLENALYFLPEAMVWFGVYEGLKGVANSVSQAF
ncbi:PET8 [Symbiodinium sp. CCMP2456]|nr:PET8 [Symbiodinium sp. CCMP2456]